MALLLIFLTLLAGQPELLSERGLRRQIEKLVADPTLADGFWGIAIYAPMRGKYLLRRNAERNFRPASNMKIVTTLLAFETLGPDYVFETGFSFSGAVRDGELDGDLIVRGGGDPSWSGHYDAGGDENAESIASFFEPVLKRLNELGIRRVNGRLIAVVDFFDNRAIQDSWEWDDLGLYYGTPVTPLALNDGWVDLRLDVNERGELSSAFFPPWTSGVTLVNRLSFDAGPETMQYRRVWGSNQLILEGNLPPCSEADINFSVWNPPLQFLDTFRGLCGRAGIEIRGESLVAEPSGRGEREETVLVSVASRPLRYLARTLMKQSQNHYADCFFKTVSRLVSGKGSFEGAASLALALIDSAESPSANSDGARIRDGSGLSGQNYLRPIQITALLDHAMKQDYWRQWLATFPVMGEDGTLSGRGAASPLTAGRVWAKTGYIFRSRSLSGYVETLAGEPLIFSILVNNYGVATSQINSIQDHLCEMLIRLRPSFAVSCQAESLGRFLE